MTKTFIKITKFTIIACSLALIWNYSLFAQSSDKPDPKSIPYLDGIWYDSETNGGFYNFMDAQDGEFIFEDIEGKKYKGTYEKLGLDDEGNRMYQGIIPASETKGEEKRLFFKIYANDKAGYFQHRCMKRPIFKMTQS